MSLSKDGSGRQVWFDKLTTNGSGHRLDQDETIFRFLRSVNHMISSEAS